MKGNIFSHYGTTGHGDGSHSEGRRHDMEKVTGKVKHCVVTSTRTQNDHPTSI